MPADAAVAYDGSGNSLALSSRLIRNEIDIPT